MGAGICPCKDCPDREVGCHSGCDRYAEWCQRRRKLHEQIREMYRGAREFGSFRRKTFESVRRKYKIEKGLRD